MTCSASIRVFAFVLAGLLFALPASAQVPSLISYQGVLTDNSGNIVSDGYYNLFIRIYDAGGATLWSNLFSSVPVSKGGFSVVLGQIPGAGLAALPFDRPYFLGIAVNGGAELSPRVQLTSSPYALALRLPYAAVVSSSSPVLDITNSGSGAGLKVNAPPGNAAVGDAAVQLPNDAINSHEMRDEPGIAYANVHGNVSVASYDSNSLSNVMGITISVPGPGYVEVQFSGTATLDANNPFESTGLTYQIDSLSGGPQLMDRYQKVSIRTDDQVQVTNVDASVHAQHVFTVGGSGTYSYYVNAYKFGQAGNRFTNPSLIATFVPTSYGAIATSPSLPNPSAGRN